MNVTWSEDIDAILGGDLTAALAYLTPAGGAGATSVAPVGLRDRRAGWVGFTTSLGFGKKLERIDRDPRVCAGLSRPLRAGLIGDSWSRPRMNTPCAARTIEYGSPLPLRIDAISSPGAQPASNE
jgi:hypothetical protein